MGTQVLFYEPFTLRACDFATGEDLWSIPGLADEPITVPQVFDGMVYTTSYNLRTNSEATGLPTFESLLQECDTNRDRLIDNQEAKNNRSILSRPDADGEGDIRCECSSACWMRIRVERFLSPNGLESRLGWSHGNMRMVFLVSNLQAWAKHRPSLGNRQVACPSVRHDLYRGKDLCDSQRRNGDMP